MPITELKMIKYVCEDGTIFREKDDAETYTRYLEMFDFISKTAGTTLDDLSLRRWCLKHGRDLHRLAGNLVEPTELSEDVHTALHDKI